ncbi:SagB family peptide dehydrogenase [Kitasatospora sp. NPDC008050]|uniref:SagB/ThcOx family dehydrogenase n=1 Tax=Kitasatospora sp. NPDC008050 TaxID=3364021 RepID=UPI0036E17916
MTTQLAPTAGTAAPAAGAPVRLSLREEVRLTAEEDALLVEHPSAVFRLRKLAPELRAAIELMRHRPVDLHGALADAAQCQADVVAERLGRLLRYHVAGEDGRDALWIEPMAAVAHRPTPVAADAPLRMSGFALIRAYQDGLVLESPLSAHRVRLRSSGAQALAAATGRATTAAELSATLGLPVGTVRYLVGHLAGAGLLDLAERGEFGEERDETLRQWDFHDLLFHARSRLGRHDYPFGGVFPHRGVIDPQPATKPTASFAVVPAAESAADRCAIALPRPRIDRLLERDPSLTAALEGRRSVRQYAAEPISLDQLGEFLYRSARVRSLTEARPHEGMPYPASSRPYPTGGAAYDLELYLTVHRCAGVPQGIYHYDPVGHQLVLVNRDRKDCEALLALARLSAGGADPADLLITVTSRFQRLSWKYRSLAYAATLKNVGVLYQTMYLVATTMGLAPCALGGGDSDLAARVLGLDYLRESSVGEFLLGSRPAGLGPQRGDWEPVNDPGWSAEAERALGPQGRA